MTDLIEGLANLHTTELGVKRIRRNLHLKDDQDVVFWCTKAVKEAEIIIRQGKNWYAYRKGIVVTVNVRSNTIITAQPIKAKIRAIEEEDYPCLREFLYQAIFIPDKAESLPKSIINEPELIKYIEDFGRQGDCGMVAEMYGQVIGAAWTRIMQGFGTIDSETPEFAISILPEFRGYGIGKKLMKKLFTTLREKGYTQTTLSVSKDNPAVRFYHSLGFRVISDIGDRASREDFVMIKDLREAAK